MITRFDACEEGFVLPKVLTKVGVFRPGDLMLARL